MAEGIGALQASEASARRWRVGYAAKERTVIELVAALHCAVDAFVNGADDFEMPNEFGSAEEYLKAVLAKYGVPGGD